MDINDFGKNGFFLDLLCFRIVHNHNRSINDIVVMSGCHGDKIFCVITCTSLIPPLQFLQYVLLITSCFTIGLKMNIARVVVFDLLCHYLW